MVNSEEFTERIKKILDYYELSASSFADKIDVGRSSISHILSGRNKPSLDFIMKILETFPEIDLYWLMNGKGNFMTSSPSEEKSAIVSSEKHLSKQQHVPSTDKQIDKIIIFYKDRSFESFENNS